MEDSKACSRCKSILPLDLFYKSAQAKTGRQSRCKQCQSAMQSEARRQNPETFRTRDKITRSKNKILMNQRSRSYYWRNKESLATKKKAYQASNLDLYRLNAAKRRAINKAAKVFLVTKEDVVKILLLPCIYCGAKSQHIDHIIPLARGGDHGIGNLAPSCARCNISKKDRFITEWKMSVGSGTISARKKEGNNG